VQVYNFACSLLSVASRLRMRGNFSPPLNFGLLENCWTIFLFSKKIFWKCSSCGWKSPFWKN